MIFLINKYLIKYYKRFTMSIDNLFVPNVYDLYCHSLTPTIPIVGSTGPTGPTGPAGSTGSNMTYAAQFSGPWASPQSGTVKATRVDNIININLPSLAATASVSGQVITMTTPTALDPIFRPAVTQHLSIAVTNNSVIDMALITVSTSGTIIVGADLSNTTFTASGTAGFGSTSICYGAN